ncbi:YfbM family protein [Scleromatobacter humisilvae]|uniref:YfbM family protein n=1 Tax=Scleromatobacter humisilvae TaxID=2897159 RepID=A0A9X1YNK4_9BURK|nr:YfbM family protein [Scleromatobacter humisilvae]MCK9684846.1 YfbM family protein [Scleromatobacter humisilvae]
MGMIACLAPLTAEQLETLRGDPDSLQEFIFPDEDTYAPPKGSIDLDKSWHGMHYLLTGTADGGEGPLGLPIIGGEELGEDMGVGPARFLTPQQVGEVSAALSGLAEAALAARYDPQDMDAQQIYPSGIWERDGAQGLDYVLHYYRKLVAFYAGAAQRGDAVLLWIA